MLASLLISHDTLQRATDCSSKTHRAMWSAETR